MENSFDEDYYDDIDPDEELLTSCPKCGREYDEIGYELQYCKVCGWDATNGKWDKPLEPTDKDIEMGDADFNGRWI